MMRGLVSWMASAGVGFWRACVVFGVSMLAPAVWAAAVGIWFWWWGGGPWSWIAPLVWAVLGTLALVRPVCRITRHLVARWTGTVLPGGYRQPGPVTQLSTGYWWNGYSYSRTSREAKQDQAMRIRWRDPANWRDLRFTGIAVFAIGVPAALPLAGIACAVLGFAVLSPIIGALGVVVALASAPYAWRPLGPVAGRFLRASPAMAMADRVTELTAQRADTTVAQAAEIRRIERDLHDGAQARLVALGMSLATAEKLMETDPERAKAMLRDARTGAATSLSELRELIKGINPPLLNERGLLDAVRAFALDSPLEVTVSGNLDRRLDPPIESALYFGIAELVTNAVKHAAATLVEVSLVRDDTGVIAEVTDDGRGGATMREGGGLARLRRRLAVFDGSCEITSPEGGPTRVRMVLPCASS